MIHKVALTPLNQFEQARAAYKSNQSEEVRFNKLLELIDMKTRYKFQYYDSENSAVLDKIQADLGKEIGKSLMGPALAFDIHADSWRLLDGLFDQLQVCKNLLSSGVLDYRIQLAEQTLAVIIN